MNYNHENERKHEFTNDNATCQILNNTYHKQANKVPKFYKSKPLHLMVKSEKATHQTNPQKKTPKKIHKCNQQNTKKTPKNKIKNIEVLPPPSYHIRYCPYNLSPPSNTLFTRSGFVESFLSLFDNPQPNCNLQ